MPTAADWGALALTLRLAAVTTAVLLALCTPLAWWLARTRRRWAFVLEALAALPLVLPPTVLGFYLLVLLGPHGPVGALIERLGLEALTFSFPGLVIGSVIYSFPFVLHPLQDAFAAIGRRPLEVAATLRAGPLDRFVHVALPLARPGYLTAAVLGFAHTLGEFGVVLMIGGNIPGETNVVSIAVYDHVEALAYGRAHALAALLLGVSFCMLVALYAVNRRARVVRP